MFQIKRIKGQVTAVLLLLVIIIFIGLGVFLLSMAKYVSQTEYMQIYTNQLLLSLLRKDTGYEGECRTLADTITCIYFLHPGFRCGTTGPTCSELARTEIEKWLKKYELIKGYKYLFTVKPVGFIPHSQSGVITTFEFGDKTLENYKGNKIVTTQKLERTTASGQFILDVKLIIAK